VTTYRTPKKIEVFLSAIIHDRKGNVVARLPRVHTECLIAAFLKLLKVQVSQAAETIKDTGGVDRSPASNVMNLQTNATAGETTWGLVVGTGTNPVTMTDNKLQTQVTASVAYGTVGFSLNAPDASTFVFAITRQFSNNTGATLSIREVGWYFRGGSGLWIFCADRTLYSVDVPAGLAVTFTYDITITL